MYPIGYGGKGTKEFEISNLTAEELIENVHMEIIVPSKFRDDSSCRGIEVSRVNTNIYLLIPFSC